MGIGRIDEDNLIGDVVRKSVSDWMKGVVTDNKAEIVQDYHKFYVRRWIFLAVCAVLVFVLFGLTLTIGDYRIEFWDCFGWIWKHITGNVGTTVADKTCDYVIWTLRLPTAVVGVIAGVALSICGVAMQSILKNPLADPYTTGVSSGAGFGATMAIVMGASIATDEYAIVSNAFVFSLIPTAVIILVSKIKQASPTTMIMAGVAVMYIFNAATTIIKLWGDPNSLSAVLQWQVGSIGGVKWANIPLMAIATVIGYIIIQLLSRKLNVLATGEDNAKALGLDVNGLRILMMVVVALLAATIVSFTGLIGFIGLVAPHVVRIVIGADNRYLVPISAMFGAAILLAANAVGHLALSPTVIPVGVITSLLGGPMFLWLLLRKKSEVWG